MRDWTDGVSERGWEREGKVRGIQTAAPGLGALLCFTWERKWKMRTMDETGQMEE